MLFPSQFLNYKDAAPSAGAVEYAVCTSAEGQDIPSRNEATCWPWVTTRNAWGQEPSG